MSMTLKTAMGIAGLALATQAAAQVTLFSRDDFRGRQFTTDGVERNLAWAGFNDRAESVIVAGGSWQVCEDAEFSGRCAILRPGEYRSLADLGLDGEVSSVRPVGERYGYYDRGGYYDRSGYSDRRAGERLFEAPVTSVHAVVGPPERRCWIERRDYVGNANVPGAIAGAVIGGILGHQIGSGHGRDAATAGGAVAGAAIGANVGGRDDYSRDVQRCTDVTRYDHPEYWDVTYAFRGREHHVAMTSPPGATITVNRDGEPLA
ncbi:MAG TPA: beta/gamma crystallin-related protein [Casimicrobiaceae bacterium]